MVAAFVWFFAKWREPGLPGLVLAFAVTGYAAALMVSPFSYLSLKQIDVDKRVKYLVLRLRDPAHAVPDQRGSADHVVRHVRVVCHLRSGAVVSAQAAASARAVLPEERRMGPSAQRVSRRARHRSLGVRGTRLLKSLRCPEQPRVGRCGRQRRPRRSRARRHRLDLDAASAAPADWGALRERVAGCTACAELCKTRTQTVFGVGNTRAEWLVIGEAPGAEEDRQGEPFVGRAGQLLNAMLLAIGLPRETVFIANILKCRPPGNRDPKPEEVSRCLPYLSNQIALLKPKIMLAVGRIAAQNLLATDAPLARLRGKLHHFGEANTPLVITYHPAYLLRTPSDKRKAWEDLKFARATHARVIGGGNLMAAAPEDLREVPEVHIRPMMEIDLPEVAAIEQKSYAFPWSENIFRDCLRVGYTCRALDLAGQIIGYGVMSLGAGEAHILNVCVREEFRSRGFRPPAARAPAGTRRGCRRRRGLPRSPAQQPGRDPPLSTTRIRTNRHSARVLSGPRWARRRHRAEAQSSASLTLSCS